MIMPKTTMPQCIFCSPMIIDAEQKNCNYVQIYPMHDWSDSTNIVFGYCWLDIVYNGELVVMFQNIYSYLNSYIVIYVYILYILYVIR